MAARPIGRPSAAPAGASARTPPAQAQEQFATPASRSAVEVVDGGRKQLSTFFGS
jgi:hypothetical protein